MEVECLYQEPFFQQSGKKFYEKGHDSYSKQASRGRKRREASSFLWLINDPVHVVQIVSDRYTVKSKFLIKSHK